MGDDDGFLLPLTLNKEIFGVYLWLRLGHREVPQPASNIMKDFPESAPIPLRCCYGELLAHVNYPENNMNVSISDVVLKTLVLAKAVLVLALDGLKDLKNCGLKTKRPSFRPKRS